MEVPKRRKTKKIRYIRGRNGERRGEQKTYSRRLPEGQQRRGVGGGGKKK